MLSRDDYWKNKEDRDREWQAEQARNKPRIERQHSQHMALLYCQMDDDRSKLTTKELCELIDWFQRDIGRSPERPTKPVVEPDQIDIGGEIDQGHVERMVEHGMKFKHP